MSLQIELTCPPLPDLDFQTVAETVTEAVIREENCPYECQIGLILTDDPSIRRLNREYRQIDRATDVLSFPMQEPDAFLDYALLEEKQEDHFDPDTGELLLGDIIISLDRVTKQAEAYGHSVKREYAFLIAHSMLHLFGYDHEDPDEAKKMEEKQRIILERLGIKR